MRYSWLIVALVLVPLSHLNAQESPLLHPGARVRVSVAASRVKPNWMVGTVISSSVDHITIWPERDSGHQVELARSSLTRLEVSQGQHSRWLAGFGLGFLAGTAAGAATGYSLTKGDEFGGAAGAVLLAIPGGLVGALIGGLVGHASITDRWQVVPLATVSLHDPPGSRAQFLVSFRIGR